MTVKNEMVLTELQQAAVNAEGKNVLVSAGAGTGKTRVLVERFLRFVTSGECDVTEILAITFTDKAANEMKQRIRARLGELGLERARRQLEAASISTIHAFASDVLKEHPLEAGVDPGFRVLEPEEASFLLEQIQDELFEQRCIPGESLFDLVVHYGEEVVRRGVTDVISEAANAGVFVDKFLKPTEENEVATDCSHVIEGHFNLLEETDLCKEWRGFYESKNWDWNLIQEFRGWFKNFSRRGGKEKKHLWKEIAASCDLFVALQVEKIAEPSLEIIRNLAIQISQAYSAKKQELGFLDFDDLQQRVVHLLRDNEEVSEQIRKKYQERFKQILVDEFQDTNALQYDLIKLLSSENNLFLVGDYKQSIYGFRGANPNLFLELEKDYQESKGGGWIPLLENFRTKLPTLNIINRFFGKVWSDASFEFNPLLSGLEADGAEDSSVECLKIEQAAEEGIEKARLREAEKLAERARELNESGTSYRDMAILFESMTHVNLYEQALKRKGIPYYVLSGRGFYNQPEIKDLLSFLAFLDNPHSDIPFAAILRSPFFQIHDDTLFWFSQQVKGFTRRGQAKPPLYDAFSRWESMDMLRDEEKKKLQHMQEVLSALMSIKDSLKLSELLESLLKETGYEMYLLADSQGVRRYANVRKLINLAREWERREGLSLSAFITLVRRLETQEVRESEAQVEAEQSGDVVKLLTIHRSKGLEYPVVFLADMGHRYQGSQHSLLVVDQGGRVGLKVRNPIARKWESTHSWQSITAKIDASEKEEWKRKLYVAMTRAENKLILSGVVQADQDLSGDYEKMNTWMQWILKDFDEEIILLDELKKSEGGLKGIFESRESWLEFFRKPLEDQKVSPEVVQKAEEELSAILEQIQQADRLPARTLDLPVSAFVAFKRSPEIYKQVYEWGIRDDLWVKSSEYQEPSEEEFFSSADFGTCMHACLEMLDFQDEWQRSDVDRFFVSFSEENREMAWKLLTEFRSSDCFRDLQSAKVLKKEIPFDLNERHGLINGVMDLLYQDKDGDWHILDYKTAVGSDEKVEAAAYEIQIQIYAYAVWKLLKIRPKTGRLYFLKNNWEQRIDFSDTDWLAIEKSIQDLQTQMMEFHRKLLV